MNLNSIPKLINLLFLSVFVLTLAGCNAPTYRGDQIEKAIQEIARKEYNINNVQVKIVGHTIGVFLPLKRLFMKDVRRMVVSGQVDNLEQLFEPEPEAMDKLENVLFAISRVLLSTDKPIDFYVLKAADVEGTGLELVLTGYINDVRRVRLWDIPRSEYRRRVIHELKLNRAILWEKPVMDLLEDLQIGSDLETMQKRFTHPITEETASPFFYDMILSAEKKKVEQFDVEVMRSRPYAQLKGLVYLKIVEHYTLKKGVLPSEVKYPSGTELEFIFVVSPADTEFKIAQVVSFQHVDEYGQIRKTKFPPELRIYDNLENWSQRFDVKEVFLGDFLAHQMNRRMQASLPMDERVRNNIKQARVNIAYVGDGDSKEAVSGPHRFEIQYHFVTRSMRSEPTSVERVLGDQDVRYVFEVMLRELAELVYSYQFRDFERVDLVWEPSGTSEILSISRGDLEAFRKRKIDIQTLLSKRLMPVQA